MKFKHLFMPIKINNLLVKNRIVAAPINNTYEEKALGGAGIVIAGHAIVEPFRSSYSSADEIDIFSKYEYEDTRRRVLKIHQAGAKASIELFHAGQEARCHEYAKGPCSYVRDDGVEVRGMDETMMQETLDYYHNCAQQAKELGFDMLFMHFGHGWLPAQFLSPYFNHRTDEYGGSFENRVKYPREILKTVRDAVGPDFPIDMRISAYEWVEGSIEFNEVVQFIQLVEPYIDTVQISAGLDMNREANVHTSTTNFEEYMPNVKWAQVVKQNVQIPVSVVGAIMSPEAADALIAEGKVDMVAFARAFIADPDWPKKALEGREEDIRPCLRCLQCYHIATNHKNVGCSVNPRFNNETFVVKEPIRTRTPKRVMIIGGGPAGMQAAITASQAGHQVTLVEKEAELGGQLRFVSKEHYKNEVYRFLEYLNVQMKKSNVEVMCSTEATPEFVRKHNPDKLLIAVGSREVKPPIPGLEQDTVWMGTESIGKEQEMGDSIVILGGGTIGSEIALELSLIHKKHVTIVEMGNELAAQGNILYKIALRQKMEQTDRLRVLLNTRCQKIEGNQMYITDNQGETGHIEFDQVIICTGVRSNHETAESLYGIVQDTVSIGDCCSARKIMDAIFEGQMVAMNM